MTTTSTDNGTGQSRGLPPPRRRNAAASRRELLEAASELFAERGYSRTTLRQVASRAGLDAALVVRYFGSKDGLYQAVLAADLHVGLPSSVRPLDPGTPSAVTDQMIDRFLTRWDSEGVGPLVLSLTRPQVGEETRREVRRLLGETILTPLAQAAAASNAVDPELRAEIVLAALCGVGTMRSVGSLGRLAAADSSVLEPILRAVAVAALDA
ncbi:MAG TPA: TetR family transcriptional regulator [Candidatus Nanopelagicales bacterium]|jgi:AcrR family transcriptional regulator